ncbi:MAG: outer membrane protein assembly factor BamD, partial [Bradyrhizobium sp.]|nr:outer membrane protein assembly factor BamD [Bradyrhizobium sp.]
MSIQRLTREVRHPAMSAGHSLRLAASLVLLALPLAGCGSGGLWDKFLAKDDTFVDEPADKLYNEGLYLMNEKK